MIDSNCRITEREGCNDGIVGPLLDEAWRHTHITDSFLRFCRRAGITIVNTFEGNVADSGWQGSLFVKSGLRIRCDYIGASSNVSVIENTFEAWVEFQMLNVKPDHVPLRCDVRYGCTRAMPAARRRKAKYSRQSVF